MTDMTCVHCRSSFDKEEGYGGSAEKPYCMKPLCLAAYFSAARALVHAAASSQADASGVNGFDVEHYRNSQRGQKA